MTFKNWLKEVKLEFSNPTQPVKKWSAGKEDIIRLWKSLNPDIPLKVNPIKKTHKGSTYGEDGVRITGSPEFISSVLSKLKPFLNYETQSTKLAVSYRETQSPSQVEKGNLKKSYVFYVQIKEREGDGSSL